jgi:hypothetical protein
MRGLPLSTPLSPGTSGLNRSPAYLRHALKNVYACDEDDWEQWLFVHSQGAGLALLLLDHIRGHITSMNHLRNRIWMPPCLRSHDRVPTLHAFDR